MTLKLRIMRNLENCAQQLSWSQHPSTTNMSKLRWLKAQSNKEGFYSNHIFFTKLKLKLKACNGPFIEKMLIFTSYVKFWSKITHIWWCLRFQWKRRKTQKSPSKEGSSTWVDSCNLSLDAKSSNQTSSWFNGFKLKTLKSSQNSWKQLTNSSMQRKWKMLFHRARPSLAKWSLIPRFSAVKWQILLIRIRYFTPKW